MTRVFTPYRNGFAELRLSSGARSLVGSAAQALASRAGRGYVASAPRAGAGRAPRARSIVYADTWHAKWDNARNNTLVKLTGGGG